MVQKKSPSGKPKHVQGKHVYYTMIKSTNTKNNDLVIVLNKQL